MNRDTLILAALAAIALVGALVLTGLGKPVPELVDDVVTIALGASAGVARGQAVRGRRRRAARRIDGSA